MDNYIKPESLYNGDTVYYKPGKKFDVMMEYTVVHSENTITSVRDKIHNSLHTVPTDKLYIKKPKNKTGMTYLDPTMPQSEYTVTDVFTVGTNGKIKLNPDNLVNGL